MHWTTWWLFVTTETALCLTPGPAVLFVISSALRSGARRSLASNLGILAGNTFYFALSGTGVGALLVASYSLFFTIKWIGAAYLIFLGLRALLAKVNLLTVAPGAGRDRRAWRLFADALLVQLSNPKAIVFFAALLPQFIDPRGPVARQLVILALTSLVIEFSVLLSYGLAAGRATQIAREPRYAAWTSRLAGVFLIGAGTGLAALNRN
ncbi:MAG TPA: LysE family translocator [Bryobacteraceae bacterium]|nr:LysE family translocator [Bryobacteraceae bacterium]